MNVRDRLIEALNPLEYEVALQGSYAEDEPLPQSFITYFIVDSYDQAFYGNNPKRSVYSIQIEFYSKDFSLIKSVPDLIYQKLKDAGFIRQSKGRDIAYDAEHYAWQADYYYMERSY